ncbi:MAG: aminotransferase class V-fold PLP-dependent enzyme [Kordiimonadaceae bacterium]|nr:aminotransferase class V-fold PLP-dependent enzyme [Kordiimonadaceae bacterium]
MSRRNILKSASTLPLVSYASSLAQVMPSSLPDKKSFEEMDVRYINSASQHPISLASSKAAENYLAKRRLHPDAPKGLHDSTGPLSKFAKLINADEEEIAYVQSTTAGEQMVLRSLGFPHDGGHIVTDTLHFSGSIPTYKGLNRMGVDVTWVKDRDGVVHPEDIKKALRSDTKLIALSLVAMHNGFEQDLKAVCDIAHANGTLVYADIIQAAGAIPIDVKESGVDFAACSSYKWLMGDFGTGFLYVRKEIFSQLKRINFGYFNANAFRNDVETDEDNVNFGYAQSASSYFAMGTRPFATVAILEHSLDYILNIGVHNIQTHAQKMTDHLKEELPTLGYKLITPKMSKSPIVSCDFADASKVLGPRLNEAKVKISVYADSFRISPSVFNDMDDIDRLLRALKI